jgi:ubiquinone/menaquinone biosynthesis C-methylase UbiE
LRINDKKSVVALYENDVFSSFLRNVLHPGGLELTKRVGEAAGLNQSSRVLDIACGSGESLLLLAEMFGCAVTGIDLSEKKVLAAREAAGRKALTQNPQFLLSDAEELPFVDDAFDVILSECSFSLLPDKGRAASEIGRVLKRGGGFVMTDIVSRPAKEENDLHGPAASSVVTLPCIAGAQTQEEYISLFRAAGLAPTLVEDHSRALRKLGYQIGLTFGGWEEFLSAISLKECCGASAGGGSGERAMGYAMAYGLGYVLMRLEKPNVH